MTVIPCGPDEELRRLIEEYASDLSTHAHLLGGHGLSEKEFYSSGIFRGAIELLRGQFSADKSQKREFIRLVLNHMEDTDAIAGWEQIVSNGRQDYEIALNSGKIAYVVTKGCLDGNNTTIFDRPAECNELVIWSLCTNLGADMRRNAWSGVHTRLRPGKTPAVDGIIIWDMFCGTLNRPCPKLLSQATTRVRTTKIGHFRLPPPCVYVFPEPAHNSTTEIRHRPRELNEIEILSAFHSCFGGFANEVNQVRFADLQEKQRMRTLVIRDHKVVKDSGPQAHGAEGGRC